jgi:hypothetical protein
LPPRGAAGQVARARPTNTTAAPVSPPQVPLPAPQTAKAAGVPANRVEAPIPAQVAVATAPSLAAPAGFGSAAVARMKQDWMLLGGALSGGVLLGAAIWLAVWSRTPVVPLAAHDPPAAHVPLVQAPDAVAREVADRQPVERSTSPTEEVIERQPSTGAIEGPDAAPHAEAPLQQPAPKQAVNDLPLDHQGADGSSTSTPAPTGQPTPSAIKLDPIVAAGEAVAEGDADSPSQGTTAADDAPAIENPAGGAKPNASAGNPPGARPPRSLSQADIDERLAGALPTVQFVKVPLAQFVEFIADFTNVPISIDERSLEAIGKKRQTPVTVKLTDTTAGDALRTALARLGLTCATRDGKLVVTAAQRRPSAK